MVRHVKRARQSCRARLKIDLLSGDFAARARLCHIYTGKQEMWSLY